MTQPSLTEADIIDIIARELDIRLQERGVEIPVRPLGKLPGAMSKGTTFIVPDSTAGNSIVVSDGEGNWNEYQHVGPVS